MNPRKTLALADPLEPDVAADGGAQGPMAQQHTDGSGINELHPQQLPQLVGFRDPDAGKHRPRCCGVTPEPYPFRSNRNGALDSPHTNLVCFARHFNESSLRTQGPIRRGISFWRWSRGLFYF